MNPLGAQFGTASHVVSIVGVAAVDDDIAWRQPRSEIRELRFDGACRHHQPEDSGGLQDGHHLVERGGTCRPLLLQRIDRRRLNIVHDTLVTVPHQAAR